MGRTGKLAAPGLNEPMQTFRAYLRDAEGVITWAAWIDAAHRDEAETLARGLRPDETPSLDLWSATDRRPDPACELEPV
jgi:hypothetical protein